MIMLLRILKLFKLVNFRQFIIIIKFTTNPINLFTNYYLKLPNIILINLFRSCKFSVQNSVFFSGMNISS